MSNKNFTPTIIAIAISCVVLFVSIPTVLADYNTGACYSVSDADARTMCLARAHREPAQCYSVQRADLRAQCLAEVRK